MILLYHIVLLQLVWWTAILSAIHISPWLCLIWVPIFLGLFRCGVYDKTDALAAGMLLIAGLVLDSIWIWLDLIHHTVPWPSPMIAPIWLLILWFCVGFDFRHSLLWLEKNPIIGGILAGASGISSYWGGAALGIARIPESTQIIFAIALFISWAVLFPLFARWLIKTQPGLQ